MSIMIVLNRNMLMNIQRCKEAISIYDQAISLNPIDAKKICNKVCFNNIR